MGVAMDIRVEDKLVEEGRVTLKVRVAECELASLRRGAYLIVAQRNGIDVRGEKTSREILEETLGEKRTEELACEAMKNFVAPFALSNDGDDYSVVGAPRFEGGETFDENGDMLFEATWVRLPAMELSSYDPVEIAAVPIEVSEEEIDAHIDAIAESYGTVERDKGRRIVEDGSIVELSMDCRKDGEQLSQLCFENRLYRAGSEQMPKGFDEAIMGAKVGTTVHVDFVLPTREELDGTLSGPSVTGEVTIKAIMREVGRVLTDEFVDKNIPGASSLADLRAQALTELARKKAEQIRHYRNFQAAGELAKRVCGTIPDEAYEAVADQMADSLFEQARAEHMTVDEFLGAQGMSEEQYRMMALMQARTQLRQGVALDAWARHRGIAITDEDIDAFFASSAQDKGAQMRGEIENGGYLYLAREGALRLKASEDLVASAIVTEDASASASGEGMRASV